MLDRLSLDDFAPVRSRSALPGSGGAKSSESVVGEGGMTGVSRTSDSDSFGASPGVFEVEAVEGAAGASVWVLWSWSWSSDVGDRGVESEAACAAFFGGIDPEFTENARVRWVEGAAVARRRAVRERRTVCMN